MHRDNAAYQSYTCVQLSISYHEHLARRKPGVCTTAITPADVSPVRTPQAVHDVIAAALANSRRNVLEIGSRNGDGVSCFAQAAKAASVIESASSYCRSLEKRAASLRQLGKKDFAIECGFFPAACNTQPFLCSYAEVFTWWMLGGQPHLHIFHADKEHPLLNADLLYELAKLHARGQTHLGAVAIIPFELSMPADRHDLGVLIHRGNPNPNHKS
jgi:hypothetical protein